MHSNAITQALEKIIKSQRKVTAIAQSLRKEARSVLTIGNFNEAQNLESNLTRVHHIMKKFDEYANVLEIVRVSRMKRAAALKERQQIAN